MRKPLVLALAAAAVAAGTALAAPASADTCLTTVPAPAVGSCTDVVLTVATGTLSILVTPAAAGTSGVAPATNTLVSDISLGATVVTDTRPASGGWHTTATASQFTSAVPNVPAIGAGASTFYVDQTVAPVLVGTVNLGTTPTSAAAVANGGTVVTATATGPNTATFTPRLKVAVPAGQATGVYNGTVTQSVI